MTLSFTSTTERPLASATLLILRQPSAAPWMAQRSREAQVILTWLATTIGGVPAVLLAAYVVKSLPLATLRWGVVVVVLYAAALLLRSAFGSSKPVTRMP